MDNREELKKRCAYSAYKVMLSYLQEAKFLRLDIKRGHYVLQCMLHAQLLQIHWAMQEFTLQREEYFEVFDCYGTEIKNGELQIGSSPIYITIKQEA